MSVAETKGSDVRVEVSARTDPMLTEAERLLMSPTSTLDEVERGRALIDLARELRIRSAPLKAVTTERARAATKRPKRGRSYYDDILGG